MRLIGTLLPEIPPRTKALTVWWKTWLFWSIPPLDSSGTA